MAQELVYNTGVHVDHHDLWIDSSNSAHMILGNDGGLYTTWDNGANWTFISNIPIQQFYDIDLDMADPTTCTAACQDNNSYRGPSRTTRYHGILNRDWQVVDYGDGMYAETDPSDTGIAYITSQKRGIVRVDMATGDRKGAQALPARHHRKSTASTGSRRFWCRRTTRTACTWAAIGCSSRTTGARVGARPTS